MQVCLEKSLSQRGHTMAANDDLMIREFRELLDNRGYRGTLGGRPVAAAAPAVSTLTTVAAKTMPQTEKPVVHT